MPLLTAQPESVTIHPCGKGFCAEGFTGRLRAVSAGKPSLRASQSG